jgi:hypothetical protein
VPDTWPAEVDYSCVRNSVGAQRFTVLDTWPIEVNFSCVRNSVGVQRFSILDLQPIEVDCSCSGWCWFCGLFFLMPCLRHKRQKSSPHLISTSQSN